jgi:predicted metallo-beta-lactamase superfamily hydrolase
MPLLSMRIQPNIFTQKKPHPIENITPIISETTKALVVSHELVRRKRLRYHVSNAERVMSIRVLHSLSFFKDTTYAFNKSSP